MNATKMTPGSTVKVLGNKPASLYPQPTVITTDVTWEPASDVGSTGGVVRLKYDPASGSFPVGAVGTVLEVSDVLDGTYVKVIVGSVIGWLNSQRIETIG